MLDVYVTDNRNETAFGRRALSKGRLLLFVSVDVKPDGLCPILVPDNYVLLVSQIHFLLNS